MELEQKKFVAAKKIIAGMADNLEDIPAILIALARVSDEEWEGIIQNGKHHRKVTVKAVCVLCSNPFEAYCLKATYDEICPECVPLCDADAFRIAAHRSRAKRANLPATLRIAEWLAAKKHFNQLCAYCQRNPIEVIDHFIPICLMGGTVASNVVPACEACNRKKMYVHPDKVRKIPVADIERVREYLSRLKIAS